MTAKRTRQIVKGTEIELFINLKTANALGLSMPSKLLGGAAKVIE